MDEIEAKLREALKDPDFRARAEADPEAAIRELLEDGELSDDDLAAVAGGASANLQQQMQSVQQMLSLYKKLTIEGF